MAESPIQSSFIPRDTALPQATPQARYRSSTGLYDLLMLVAIVLFIASAVLAVGVFLYEQFLQTQSQSKLDQLQRAKAAFEPALIQQLTRLDDRMHTADTLLASHLAPSLFFNVLQQVTLQTVSFDSLNFDGSDPSNMSLRLSGVAQSVNSIALQADLFAKSTLLQSPIFSGINRQSDGVHFTVDAKLNPDLVRYSQLIEGQSAGAAAGVPQSGAIPSGAAPSASTTQPSSPFERSTNH